MTTVETSIVELLETSSVQALSHRYRLLTSLIAIIMVPFSRDERLTALIVLMRCEIDRISLTDEAFDAYVDSFADAVKAERRFRGA
jgi:hypothetical protein